MSGEESKEIGKERRRGGGGGGKKCEQDHMV